MSFKICIVGCGQLANSHHGPSYLKYAAENPGVEFAACCDIEIQRAETFAKRFNFDSVYSDFEKMLAIEKPDAVCLLVPPEKIQPLACKILDKGIPTLIEKPPGMTLDELEKMISSAAKKQTPNQVAFNRRYTPLVVQLKEMIESAVYEGSLQHIHYDLCRVGRDDLDFSTTAIHGIDTVRFLVGSDYARVDFYYQELPKIGPGRMNIFLACRFKSGVTAHLSFTPLSGVVMERATLHSFNNIYFLKIPIWNAIDAPGNLLHIKNGEIELDLSGLMVSQGKDDFILNGFYGENASFFNDIRNGISPSGDLKSARQSVTIAQAIRERRTSYCMDDNAP
jgi:predicted dehydrogenase